MKLGMHDYGEGFYIGMICKFKIFIGVFMDQCFLKEKGGVMKVGLLGIGLDTYWPQFDGLKDRLLGYQTLVLKKLAALLGIEVCVICEGLKD